VEINPISGDRLLSEPIAAAQPWWREPPFMPHTCRSQCRWGSAQLGGFLPFAGTRSGDKVAPKAVIWIAANSTHLYRGSGQAIDENLRWPVEIRPAALCNLGLGGTLAIGVLTMILLDIKAFCCRTWHDAPVFLCPGNVDVDPDATASRVGITRMTRRRR
jgi:hypothetical protein